MSYSLLRVPLNPALPVLKSSFQNLYITFLGDFHSLRLDLATIPRCDNRVFTEIFRLFYGVRH